MRILSQDNLSVVFDYSTVSISIEGNRIYANQDSGYIRLGEYENVERAKEVLSELFHWQYEGFAMPEV